MELDTIYRVKGNDAHIVSPAGVSLINRKLDEIGVPDLPEFFPRNVSNGAGKIGKRVEKWSRMWHGTKMDSQMKSEIGKIGQDFLAPASLLIYDFTAEVCTWTKGDFGNDESCFWPRGQYETAPGYLKRGFGYGPAVTMRLFEHGGHYYGKYRGIGRAFVMPYRNRYIVLNGYEPKQRGSSYFAGLFVDHLKREEGEDYIATGITLSADGIFVNWNNDRDSKLSHMVSKKNDVPAKDHYSLDAPNSVSAYYCYWCGKYAVHSYDEFDPSVRVHGGKVCSDCAAVCEVSGDRYLKRELIYAPDSIIYVGGRERRINGFVSRKYEGEFRACTECDRTVGLEQECDCG